MRIRSWSDQELIEAVVGSKSYRSVLLRLKLIPAGGNYESIKRRIGELQIDTTHFTGKGWNVGLDFKPKPAAPLNLLLTKDNWVQSYKLKNRLILAGLKPNKCEICGWGQQTQDGRVPVELDHVNGDHYDNRIENLRILCPNCHSLQSTHRGKNKKRARVL